MNSTYSVFFGILTFDIFVFDIQTWCPFLPQVAKGYKSERYKNIFRKFPQLDNSAFKGRFMGAIYILLVFHVHVVTVVVMLLILLNKRMK
jgi:hypothetical protein